VTTLKLVILPYPTYHSIRSKIIKILGPDIRLKTVLEDDIVDLANELNLRSAIRNGLKRILKEINGLLVEIYLVVVGHPYVNMLVYHMLQELVGDVKLLVWDSYRRKYLIKELSTKIPILVR